MKEFVAHTKDEIKQKWEDTSRELISSFLGVGSNLFVFNYYYYTVTMPLPLQLFGATNNRNQVSFTSPRVMGPLRSPQVRTYYNECCGLFKIHASILHSLSPFGQQGSPQGSDEEAEADDNAGRVRDHLRYVTRAS